MTLKRGFLSPISRGSGSLGLGWGSGSSRNPQAGCWQITLGGHYGQHGCLSDFTGYTDHLGIVFKCPFRSEAGPAFWIIYLIHAASGAAAAVGSWHRGPHYPLSFPGRTRSRSVGNPTDTALLCLPTEANILLCPVPSEIPSGPSVTTPPTLYSSHQRWGVPKAEEEKAEPCSDCSLWRNPRELLLGKSLLDIRRAWGGTQTVECLGQLR